VTKVFRVFRVLQDSLVSPVRKVLKVIWDQLDSKVRSVCLGKHPIPEQPEKLVPQESKEFKEFLVKRP